MANSDKAIDNGAIAIFRVDNVDEDNLCDLVNTMMSSWNNGIYCHVSLLISRQALVGKHGCAIVILEIEGASFDHIKTILTSSAAIQQGVQDGYGAIRPSDERLLSALTEAISQGTFVGALHITDLNTVRSLFKTVN
jgi:hypothetical protein